MVAGPQSSPACQAAAHALNASLGAVGKTVSYTDSLVSVTSTPGTDLRSVVADMNSGKVKWLVMMGVNPLYNAPADLNFAAAFNQVPTSVHLGTHLDETGYYATWHINKPRIIWRAGRMPGPTTAR